MKNLLYRRRFILIPFAIVAFLTLVGFGVMLLWNELLPPILHVGAITFWQALGIFILCKILFGFGKGGPKGGTPWMRHKMAERFKNMTPEEQAKFREKMGQKCGWGKWDADTLNTKGDYTREVPNTAE
ncbi:MAG: hypothetical protein NVSMB24_09330 [Mucilaginibacter sp.]